MLNQVILVGRLADELEIVEDGGHKKLMLTLTVPRSYKNANGEYDNDNIKCILWDMIASSTKEYCHKGDLIGIKGRIQSEQEEMLIVAEKITFLSSGKKEKKEGE